MAASAASPTKGLPKITGGFFTHSIAVVQRGAPLEDGDTLRPETTYLLQPHQRLEVGKYVPDRSNGKDPAGPKFASNGDASRAVTSSSSRSSSLLLGDSARVIASRPPRSSSGRRLTEGEARIATAGADPPEDDNDGDALDVDDGDDWACDGAAGASTDGAGASQVPDQIVFRVVKPSAAAEAAGVVGGLFFPIHYGKPSIKDVQDPRGLPEAINDALHPQDRASMHTDTFAVKGLNLNKMPLYKVGPGAVAFRVVLSALESGGLVYTPSNRNFNVLWSKRATSTMLAQLHPYQKINHFPGTWGIGRKDSLATNISRMRRQYGPQAIDIVPTSFLLPRDKDELAEDLREALEVNKGVPPTYIVKPSASSCGRGIKLYRGMPPIPKGEKTYVCQRYIGNPFLIQQRKFDLRMYCVVTGFDPLKIYLFDEGLVRFAAEKYPGPDKGLENTYMHLTNYSVSKTAELNRSSRGKSEDTDDPVDIKWCISDLKQWLKTNHGEEKGAAMWASVLKEVHDVIIKMFLSIEAEVVAKLRVECSDPTGRNCFELYGLDLMVDADLHVKLIEVNIMPSLATGTTLDKAVKSRMLAHMLTLARIVPYKRDIAVVAANQSKDERPGTSSGSANSSTVANLPKGSYVPGGAAERYYYPTVRGAPRGSVEQNNVSLLARFGQPSVKHSMLSPLETLMLHEADEELRSAGGFQRVFPTAQTGTTYFPYFTQGVSRNNFLLASWEHQKDRCSK